MTDSAFPDLPPCLDRRKPRVEAAPAKRGADIIDAVQQIAAKANLSADACDQAKPAAEAHKPKSWRDVLKVHPAADMFPMMSPDELVGLGNDIIKNGMVVPVALHRDLPRDKAKSLSDWQLLDGRNRLDALEAVGLTVTVSMSKASRYHHSQPFFVVRGEALKDLSEDGEMEITNGGHNFSWSWIHDFEKDPYEYVISANLHRRHLTVEQKRELIAKLLKATPEKSNRQIAEPLKASHHTVEAVRAKLEATGQIAQLSKTTGKDGKARPAKPQRDSGERTASERQAALKVRAESMMIGFPQSNKATPKPIDGTCTDTTYAALAPEVVTEPDRQFERLKQLWLAYQHTLGAHWRQSSEKSRLLFFEWLMLDPVNAVVRS